ncbi:hypothetical protein [Bradyrhizobium sp. Leo170]|uniref:hypothetical protein n=1 Tax=Bradyrhizobium sp. Leo170 TaxID=1571199 RepID=UPI001A918796|nr:hypothetical protein [Bradyrhizobium sp. Leo170]
MSWLFSPLKEGLFLFGRLLWLSKIVRRIFFCAFKKVAPQQPGNRQAAWLSISRQFRSRVLPFRANRPDQFSGQSRKFFCEGVPAPAYGQVAAVCKQRVELSSNARKCG